MVKVTQAALFLLGAAAVAIGLMIALIGPHQTALIFGSVVRSVTGAEGYGGGLETPDVSSELRFYAVLWLAYGVMLLRALSDMTSNWRLILTLLAVFFAGGLARVIGWIADGPPSLLFRVLTVIECVLPVLLAPMVAAASRRR